MSYTALYRKFRPAEFEDVKGQDHIITTLKNQIKADRIGHAYLFCGTRGTGKTTVAKIFAKAVNCEHPVDGSPCGECTMCKNIAAGTSMNVIEIDAASNNGVDNIREIREEVSYRPTEGRYKVYIIDEVHMLSIGAINALLKTLEEPPSYVIFILATTETHKIPITILSRCQRYDFKRISIETITARLEELMKAENINVEDKALRYIAKAADGSLRDALSLLDQCLAFYLGQDLKYDNVLEVLGAVDTEVFSRLLRMVLAADTTGCIRLLEDLIMQGRDLGQFVVDFVWYLRNLLLIKTSEDAQDVIDMSSDNLALLKEESGLIDDDTLMRYIRIFSELSNDVKYSTQKRIMIEIALIKLTHPAMEQSRDISDIISRITQLEQRLDNGNFTVNPGNASNAAANTAAAAGQSTEGGSTPDNDKPLPKALPEDLRQVAAQWNNIVTDIDDGCLAQMLRASNVKVDDNNTGIEIMTSSPSTYSYISRPDQLAQIRAAIAARTGKEVEIRASRLKEDQDFRNMFTDIRDLVKMDIEIDDDKEDLI